jgi:hypothetical protein
MAGKLTQRAILMVDEEGFLLVKDPKGTEAPIPDDSVSAKEAAALRKRIEELETQLRAAAVGRDNLTSRVADLQAQLTQTKDRLAQVEAELAEASEVAKGLDKTAKDLEKQLEQAQKDLTNQGTCPADLVQARKDLNAAQLSAASARQEADKAQEQARERLVELQKAQAEITKLQREIEALKKAAGNQATPAPNNPNPPAPPPVDDTPWTPARSDTNHVWGPGRHAMESLRNLRVGKLDASHNYRMAMSFRAKSSSTPSKLWYYVPFGDGYHGGNAGVLQCLIFPDKDGAPDDHAGMLGGFTRNLTAADRSSDKMYEDVFTGATTLEKGTLYWLVFSNALQTPGTYYSINTTQIRKYSGFPGIRWTPAADAAVLFQDNPGSWTNLTSMTNPGDMQSSPMFQLTYQNDVKQGSAVIESGATATRAMLLTTTPGEHNARIIREAMYIPNTITVRGISFMAEPVDTPWASVYMTLVELAGDGLSNKVVNELWAAQELVQRPAQAPSGTPAGWAASLWKDIKLPRQYTLEGGKWYALDIRSVEHDLRVAGQTNARRRGLEMPVAYIDGEARYSKDGTNFIPLNYHNHNSPNGNRNDVNWRGIALHTVEDIDSFYKQDTATQTPGQSQGNTGPLVPAKVKEKFFTMSTGNNLRPIHAWVPGRVEGARVNGESGQGGGAAVNQGKSQHLTRQDGWMLQPWIDTGNLEWVLKQTFRHYTPWFAFIEADGSPARAPGAEVAIRNLRFWVLPKGSDTWVLKSSQSTGFWCGYFHPDMNHQIGGDIQGTPYEGGVKYRFKGNVSPWPALHGSGAQYVFKDEGEFDGLLVTCEAKCLTPNAEIALQFGCDPKIFGNNKADRVWKSEEDHGWYPGAGMSRCEIITNEWKTYGFSPLQRADGTVRDGFRNNALPKARWDASKLAWDVAPELLNV